MIRRRFDLLEFFRRIPISLLQKFFLRMKIDIRSVDWNRDRKDDAEVLITWFHSLSTDLQEELEYRFRSLCRLALSSRFDVLCQILNCHKEPNWRELFAKKGSRLVKVFAAWLRHPEACQLALDYFSEEPQSWWYQRNHLPKVKPIWNDRVKKTFETGLKRIFAGRGGMEHFRTVNESDSYNDTYFFEVCSEKTSNINQKDCFGSNLYRTSPDVYFVYHSEQGILDLYYQGPKSVRNGLEEIFVDLILECRRELPHSFPFDLSFFKNGQLTLTVDQEQNIKLRLLEMKIEWRGQKTIVLNVEKECKMDWVRYGINEERLPLSNGSVSYVKFQVEPVFTKRNTCGPVIFEMKSPNYWSISDFDIVVLSQIYTYFETKGVIR